MELSEQLKKAAEEIYHSDALLITCGAGMGVDSGLPDFRGDEGFWKAYPPMRKLGVSFAEMANPIWFEDNPCLAWGFYGHRLNLYRDTIPHRGFNQLLELASSKPYGYFVFTSNVDGQFQKAGYDPLLIEECHGSIHHFQCTTPCSQQIWDASDIKVDVDEQYFEAYKPLPLCKFCDKIARPNILMFGDWNWLSNRSNEQNRSKAEWLQSIDDKRLTIIELGAGRAVPTVRLTSQRIARHYNATLVRINPRDFDVDEGHIGLPLTAADGIHRIYQMIKSQHFVKL